MPNVERVAVNGYPAIQTQLSVRKGAFSFARYAIGKMPSSDEFSWLMGILEGQTVTATVFSGTNVTGHTSVDQLRQAFSDMNPEHSFWIKAPQLEAVIAKFGDGTLGFDMSGRYCEQTPAEIEKLLTSAQVAPQPRQESSHPSTGMMKSITLVLDASGASDLDEAPTYAALDIDQVFISRIEKLLAVCQANELTEARISYCPNWGPAGIEEDLRLQCGELVVLSGGSFWFNDNSRDSGGSIQTNSESLERLKQAFASAENGAVVFLTQSMGARDDYEEDHTEEEASQRYDSPSP